MFHLKFTLNGPGGELDSTKVWVAADDPNGVRLKLIHWLQAESMVLDAGDSIVISNVKED
jgi:hypothetical protein